MKKFFKVSLALVMSLLMAVGVFAGCKAVVTDYYVGKVGNIDIMASAFYNQCATYANMYSYYGLSADNYMDEIKETVFESMVDQYLPVYHANKAGIKLDEADEAIIQEKLAEYVDSTLASYASQVDSSITDEAAIREAEMALFVADLEEGGYTYDSYINEKMYKEYADSRLAEKMYDKVIADANINITEEDARKWFDEELAAEKENFAQTPESYYTMYSSYISTKNSTDEATANSAIPPLTVPEGYYFVTHILVMNAEEGEEKDVEAIVAEIEAEIATLPETATAEEKIAKFNELIEKYNEDPGLDSEPYKTEGYLMHESLNNDSTTTYDPAFYEAALDLENMGDISAPVEGENGTHIIIRLNDVEVKDVDFASVKDAITENVKVEQENTVYEEQLAAWRETTKIVKNESRIAALNIVTTTSTGLDE